MTTNSTPIILAFSGGLDTSFCVPWLKETYGRDVITATIDTGGIDIGQAAHLKERALARTDPLSSTRPTRYQPADRLLAFLEAL